MYNYVAQMDMMYKIQTDGYEDIKSNEFYQDLCKAHELKPNSFDVINMFDSIVKEGVNYMAVIQKFEDLVYENKHLTNIFL